MVARIEVEISFSTWCLHFEDHSGHYLLRFNGVQK